MIVAGIHCVNSYSVALEMKYNSALKCQNWSQHYFGLQMSNGGESCRQAQKQGVSKSAAVADSYR